MSQFFHSLWRYTKSLGYVLKVVEFTHDVYYGNRKKIKGSGNTIHLETRSTNLKGVFFELVGHDNTIIIRNEARVSDVRIRMRGSRHKLIIQENCHIQGGSFWFEDDECQITIGRETTIEEAHIAVTEPKSAIAIGEDCMLAYDIEIKSGDSHTIIDLESNERVNYAKDVTIGNHVWVAAHVQILKGVSIGQDSVIGSGSVVTTDIPANCIAVGVPAHVARTGITWLRKRTYK